MPGIDRSHNITGISFQLPVTTACQEQFPEMLVVNKLSLLINYSTFGWRQAI